MVVDVFVARQPIFDRREKVFAYELLFRQGAINYYNAADGDQATTDVITNSFWHIGISALTGGKRGFINFTSNLLKRQIASVLPKEALAIEILETVEPDEEIVQACQQLKQAGHLLVLDDFVFDPKFDPLIDMADIIKVDFLTSSTDQKRHIAELTASHNFKLLAEKVETREDFEQALELGYSYFQGYYFCKPDIVSGKKIPAFKASCLKLLRELNSPDINLDRVHEIVKGDVALSFNLLKFINSSAFGFRSKISNIRQAVALLGIEEMKKWGSLISIKSLAEDKPDALIVNSVVRAVFGEALAQKTSLRHHASDVFLLGMLSLIDAFLDRPMSEILDELPLSEDIQQALLGVNNRYRDILQLIVAYEQADWKRVSAFAYKLQINERELPAEYLKAVSTANEFAS